MNTCRVFNDMKGIMVTFVECDHGMVLREKQIGTFAFKYFSQRKRGKGYMKSDWQNVESEE